MHNITQTRIKTHSTTGNSCILCASTLINEKVSVHFVFLGLDLETTLYYNFFNWIGAIDWHLINSLCRIVIENWSDGKKWRLVLRHWFFFRLVQHWTKNIPNFRHYFFNNTFSWFSKDQLRFARLLQVSPDKWNGNDDNFLDSY